MSDHGNSRLTTEIHAWPRKTTLDHGKPRLTTDMYIHCFHIECANDGYFFDF